MASGFLFSDTATAEIYTLSLHDALPICWRSCISPPRADSPFIVTVGASVWVQMGCGNEKRAARSEEHTSELQSQPNLVCRLLLEKKSDDAVTISNFGILPLQDVLTATRH